MNLFSQLRGLPRVAKFNKGKYSYTWEQRTADYANLPKSPILIIARLVTPIIHAENRLTHLDGILSAAAITDHPVASQYDQAAVVPLPLELLWVSDDGLPLWACTPLRPVNNDKGLDAVEYWHKRYPSHRAEFGRKLNANTAAGRWREYRTPVHTHSVNTLAALAIGSPEETLRLLETITHIGKKGSQGFGRVAKWEVIAANHNADDIVSLRRVPVASCLGENRKVLPNCPWTPPYWYAPRWSDCT